MHVRLPLAFARCRSFSFAFCPYPDTSRGRRVPRHTSRRCSATVETTETPAADPQPLIQEPEYMLDEEDRATAAEVEATESSTAVASEPSTEVPPAEARCN